MLNFFKRHWQMNVVLVGVLMLYRTAHASSTIVGNGGDLVECGAPQSYHDTSVKSGLYVLDYLVARVLRLEPMPDVTPHKIAVRLHAVNGAMGFSLTEFLESYGSRDLSQRYIWLDVESRLVDVQDEQLAEQLPANCYANRSGQAHLNIHQAVIRNTEPQRGRTLFNYDANLLENLYRQSPLQASYLLVHEWLWDFVSDAPSNRELNRYLHSQEFFEDSVVRVSRRLATYTIKSPLSLPAEHTK
jgi:hypothetical protein